MRHISIAYIKDNSYQIDCMIDSRVMFSYVTKNELVLSMITKLFLVENCSEDWINNVVESFL